MKAWLDRILGKTPAAVSHVKPQAGELLVNAYATALDLPALDFPHQLVSQRDWHDPTLAPHLAGFVQHMLGRGDGQMTMRRYALMRHIERVQQQVSLQVDAAAWPAYLNWAQQANAISFIPNASILDAQGRELMDAAGTETDPAAALPCLPQALARKARTEAALSALGLRVPSSLPATLAEFELRMREPAEIAARALATLAAAVRAEAVSTDNELSSAHILARLPDAQAALSPRELDFMQTAQPDDQSVTNMGWRYECVAVFAWALGLQEELLFPESICDVSALSRLFFEAGTVNAVLRQARPVDATELLDALDETFRLHWCVRDAQINQKPVPEGLLPGVVTERHRALNWLVRFENADWDDVDMPT